MIRIARRPALTLISLATLTALAALTVRAQQPAAKSNVAAKLAELVAVPAVSGYEQQLGEMIRKDLAALHPATDNIGDVVVTIGTGPPHRLIVTPMDEPGYVVSAITPDGYLRVQRLPQHGLPPVYNMLASAQPVKVGTTRGVTIDGVFAGLSIHLQPFSTDSYAPTADPADLDAMYVDIGAMSAAEARKAGVDVLNPITLTRHLAAMNGQLLNTVSVGDRFGAAAVLDSLAHIDPSKVTGTLTVAFVVQQRTGARGLQRILTGTQADETSLRRALHSWRSDPRHGRRAPCTAPRARQRRADRERAVHALGVGLRNGSSKTRHRKSRRTRRRLLVRFDSTELFAAAGASRKIGAHRHRHRLAGHTC